jgi:signal transduction histidine kinase
MDPVNQVAHGPYLAITLQLPVVLFLALLTFRAADGLGNDRYRYIGVGWILNLLYLTSHFLPILSRDISPLFAVYGPRVFDVVTQVCFLLAASGFGIRRGLDDWTGKLRPMILLVLLAFVWEIGWSGLFPQTLLHSFLASLPVVVVNALVLLKLANFFSAIEEQSIPLEGRSWHLVVATRAYAALQPLYLLANIRYQGIPAEVVNTIGFSLGLLFKFLIAIGIIEILQAAAKLGAKVETEKTAIARVLHELGTPIPQLEVQIAAALDKSIVSSRLRGRLELIHSTALRAVALLNAAGELPSVTQWARTFPAASKAVEKLLQPESYSVNTLIEIARIALKETRDERVTYHIAYSGRCCIYCVKMELIQIVINVLRNAYDAFPDGVGRIWIATQIVREQEERRPPREIVQIVIRDDGEGISEAIRLAMFTEGFSTRGEGRGHGMSIVEDLMTNNGGVIDFVSPAFPQHGHRLGTEVRLRFPRVACTPKRIHHE